MEREAPGLARYAVPRGVARRPMPSLSLSRNRTEAKPKAGWWDRIRSHSLGWVTARTGDGTLIGFVNVAWDGGDHAFLIDTKVHPDHHSRGMTRLVRIAVNHAKEAGCEWIEVDFDEPLAPFDDDACGFPSDAGRACAPPRR